MTYLAKHRITGQWFVVSRKSMANTIRMKKSGLLSFFDLYYL